jgi:RNA-binding protein YlmH
MRIDLILKSGLNIARNKIELAFYENKIRKNGKKILKKSQSVAVGDEIDFIKGMVLS